MIMLQTQSHFLIILKTRSKHHNKINIVLVNSFSAHCICVCTAANTFTKIEKPMPTFTRQLLR